MLAIADTDAALHAMTQVSPQEVSPAGATG